MASLLLKRRQGHALRYLLLEMAARQRAATTLAGFQTIDGEMVSYVTGEQAIRSGTAVLIGGLLVGTVLPQFDNY
ncbi:hypothetical protein [Hymenobacter yonginensis]|uniref:Uncharacterized protein n=1 Tax=Hymenobacter yonginensis TaxID=748197 RepID=A0ABY7PL86_9BACT|nr:hypothetical protein [Hymenobacter yonginensis]WBO83362.1 hypothetical protein O9Z63_13335 [Hymenobacter yonginensis]